MDGDSHGRSRQLNMICIDYHTIIPSVGHPAFMSR